MLTNSQSFALRNWILVVIVGIAVGCVGALVNVLSHELLLWKFNTAKSFIDDGKWGEAFFSYLFMSLFFIAIATSLCIWQPKAAGGGIADVKAYLNGIDVWEYLQTPVAFAKAIGTCFAVASGLPTGKKAPMIHVGSAMASIISQGRKNFININTSWTRSQDFRNDRIKADYMTYGIAAGVAATFR